MKNFIKRILQNNKFLISVNILLIILVIVLFFINNFPHADYNYSKIIRDNNSYKFTSPILDCESYDQGNSIIFSNKNFEEKVNFLKDKYGVDIASLYVRDLNNGPWLGVNEKEVFSPASLLKTPVVMALFKYAEEYPDIFKKEITVGGEDIAKDYNQNIIFDGMLKDGVTYNLKQITESSLKKSDNTAINIIIKNIPSTYILDVFYSIGVPYRNISHEVSISVKDYAAFFRVLFNSSYLSREMSESLLKILSESDYRGGIVSGVPEGTIVSHKFGERVINNVHQLHDCGIVYYPNNPYLICVMTRGGSFENEEKFISEISGYVYSEFDKINKK